MKVCYTYPFESLEHWMENIFGVNIFLLREIIFAKWLWLFGISAEKNILMRFSEWLFILIVKRFVCLPVAIWFFLIFVFTFFILLPFVTLLSTHIIRNILLAGIVSLFHFGRMIFREKKCILRVDTNIQSVFGKEGLVKAFTPNKIVANKVIYLLFALVFSWNTADGFIFQSLSPIYS